MEPGQRGHRLGRLLRVDLSRRLRDDLIGDAVSQEKGPHAVDVGAGEAADSGESRLQILAQTINDGTAPPFGLLTLDDALADMPVEGEQFPVDGQGRLDLGILNAFLEVA